MSYQSCKTIMPKFLWKHIIEYMPYQTILKIVSIDPSFSKLIDKNYNRCNFLEHRPDAIAIVKCNARYMDYFWIYALQTYIGCDDINDLFQRLEDNIKHNTGFIYYKVFIKAGEYPFTKQIDRYYVLNQNRCNIEINGSKSGSTLINHAFDRYEYCYLYNISVVIPEYFLICYIKFCNVECDFTKYNPETYPRPKYIYSNEFAKMNHYSELYIHNCIYFESCLNNLQMTCIDKSTIINCVFDIGVSIHGADYITRGAGLKPNQFELSNVICDISCSIFLLHGIYECISISNKRPIMISFTNNIILKANALFSNWYGSKVIIKANNNNIHDANMCVRNCNIKFTNNHFDYIQMLYNGSHSNVVADNTNRFTNCGEQLMNQIKN